MCEYGIQLLLFILIHLYYFGFLWFIPMIVLDIFLLDQVLAYFGIYRMKYADILQAYHWRINGNNIAVYMVIDKISLD